MRNPGSRLSATKKLPWMSFSRKSSGSVNDVIAKMSHSPKTNLSTDRPMTTSGNLRETVKLFVYFFKLRYSLIFFPILDAENDDFDLETCDADIPISKLDDGRFRVSMPIPR